MTMTADEAALNAMAVMNGSNLGISRAPDVPLDQVEWRVDGKPWTRGGDQTVCRFVPYIDAATVAGLLDQWVGPTSWRDDYEPGDINGKYVLWCHLGIYDEDRDQWVVKSDVGKPSQFESEKGCVSDAFKRAACLKWGAGRSVYDLPNLVAPCRVDNRGQGAASDATLPAILQQLKARGYEPGGRTRVRDDEDQPPDEQEQRPRQTAAKKAPAKKAAARPKEAKPKSAEEIVRDLAKEFGPEHAARVERLIDRMNGVPEMERKAVKEGFVRNFGSPGLLHPSKVEEAEDYLTSVLDSPVAPEAGSSAPAPGGPETTKEAGATACSSCGRENGTHEDGCDQAPF